MGRRKADWRRLGRPELSVGGRRRLARVIDGGNWQYGCRAQEVERVIAARLGTTADAVLATSSCTAALWLAYHLTGATARSVSPLTYPATYAPIQIDGSTPLWVDPRLGRPDIAVQLWGEDRDPMPTALIHDLAHTAPVEAHWPAFCLGAALCYSFGPTKEICSPGGGALVYSRLKSQECRKEALRLARSGQILDGRAPSSEIGIKGLMTEVSAEFVLDGFKRQPWRRQRRQAVLDVYANELPDMITRPGTHTGHVAVVRLDPALRLRVQARLSHAGIEWSIHYPMPDDARAALPELAELSDSVLTLPCHHRMNKDHARRIARVVKGA